MNPVVPDGEGEVKPLSIGYPTKLIERIDEIAEETSNSRSDTIRHLLRWACDAYKKGKAEEAVAEQAAKSKKRSA